MGTYRYSPGCACCHLRTTGAATTRQYQASGSPPAERWRYDHGDVTNGIDIFADDGRVAICGTRTGPRPSTRVLSPNGNMIWFADHGATVNDVRFDPDGGLVTGGDGASSVTTRKYDRTGSLLWSANNAGSVLGVATDDDGNAYTIGVLSFDLKLVRKYDPDGALLWSARPDPVAANGRGILWHAGALYVGFAASLGSESVENVYELDPADGSTVRSLLFADSGGDRGSALGFAVDSAGNLYVAGVATGQQLQKFEPDWDPLWIFDAGAAVGGIGTLSDCLVDGDDNVYACRTAGGAGNTHWKLDSAGSILWADSHGALLSEIALHAGRLHVTGVRVE